MTYALRHKADGAIVVNDGLHLIEIPAPVAALLRTLPDDGCVRTVNARALVVIPLAPEQTAVEAVHLFEGEVVDG